MEMTIDKAISHLYTYSSTHGSGITTDAQHEEAKRVAIETMRKYQKMQGVLDKIRAEIEQITDTMGVSYNQYVSKIDVLQILDKHKVESEKT